jgi:hypothetical protein
MSFSQAALRYVRRAYLNGHFPTLASLLANRDRLLQYHGFLGDGNFGDELVYDAARSLFRSFVLVPGATRRPIVTALLFRAGLLRFRGEVLGGGTLIGPRVELSGATPRDLRSVFVHGTGVKTKFSEGWTQAINSRLVFGGVRGRASQVRLAEKDCEVAVVGDAAFHFFGDDHQATRFDGSVLVNFGTHNVESKMTTARSEVRRFIAAVLERGVSVEFLPFHSVDVELGRELARDLPTVKVHEIPANLDQAKAIFKRASFAVGERLHFAVVSLLSGCPCFSVMYEAKHSELLDSLSCQHLGALPDEFGCADLVERYLRRADFDWATVRRKLAIYRRRQEEDARAFTAHIGIKIEEGQRAT